MSNDTIIRKPNGGGVAILHFREMNTPSWAHPRADYWIPSNDLSILGHNQRTKERFFTDRYITSTDGRFLLIEEMELDGTQESVDRHSSRLVLFDTDNLNESEVGRIDDGYCFPKRVDDDKLIYSKMRRAESGVHHEYERDISTLTWINQTNKANKTAHTNPLPPATRRVVQFYDSFNP